MDILRQSIGGFPPFIFTLATAFALLALFLFIYIRIGRPILAITSKGSPVDRILEGSGIRHVCLYPDEPAEEIDAKVLRFLAMPSAAEKASDWFHEEFDGRRQVEALSKILKGLRSARTPQNR